MSTISSPRPSITSAGSPTPTSSRRPSFDNNNLAPSNASTPTRRNPSPSVAQRRNRAALRDYYNLRPTRADSSQPVPSRSRSVPSHPDTHDAATHHVTPSTELDNPNFDPSSYISHLLSTSSLSTILKAENSLISDIRTLDGERKALVYDNYSKLIKAVETIGKMRASIEEKGEPMIMTKTLAPAIGFVAETAATMIKEQEQSGQTKKQADQERDTVRWALATPERLRKLVDEGKMEEADNDWKEVDGLLHKWTGVKGVGQLRSRCEEVMLKEE